MTTIFDYEITGGSPYNGCITVIADHPLRARAIAHKELVKLNSAEHQGPYSFTGRVDKRTLEIPMVVRVESGES